MSHRTRRVWISLLAPLLGLVWALTAPASQAHPRFRQGDPALEVYAEAIGQANLRAGPGIEYRQVGEIVAGTRYRVQARHAVVPWLRLDIPGIAEAWVYADLVTITGRLDDVPPVNGYPALDPATATPQPPVAPPATPSPVVVTPTVTLTPAGAWANTLGEANVRFGPDLSYPVITRVPEGMALQVLEMHALVPWVRVALAGSPTGSGWIYRDIVEIRGDLTRIPTTEIIEVSYPTLTPTPQTVIVSNAPWDGGPAAAGQLADTLGLAMHEYLLEQGFTPYGDQIAAVYVLDLVTGDSFALNDGVAFSGMSLTKIPILVAYFQRHSDALSRNEAFLIADTMMCSENITTNELLAQIGDGDALRGAQRVTATMQQLGLTGTFIMRQYAVREGETLPNVGTIRTGADQQRTQPDAYNQIVPKDLGWLLAGIYQCARDGTGLLAERFPGDFTAQECRQMLTAMDANTIGVFLEAGVPAGTRVIHKHGWIGDTHGDAGIVFGPNGAYVFVAVLYGRDWLEFDSSSPVIAELSRMAWNALNPENPVAAIDPRTVPAECDPWSDPVMPALLAGSLPMVR